MDQARAINALAPFVALAKSATSPRAASDLVTQATSAANTYVFAELLQQPNVQSLAGHEQYGAFHTLLQVFAWGTWESYKATANLPPLSDAQTLKLRLLSLLTIASQKTTGSPPSMKSNLSYQSLCAHLDLTSPIDLEHLVTTAIYNSLITGTLNPASQTVTINSVAPMRDLAPGSVQTMIAELAVWKDRCDSVLADLELEIKKVKSDAEKRAKREAKMEKQVKAMTEVNEKTTPPGGSLKFGINTRGAQKREQDDYDFDHDEMDVDDGGKGPGGGRKKSGGLLSKFTRGPSGRN